MNWVLSHCLNLPYSGVTALPVPKLSVLKSIQIIKRHLKKRLILFLFGQAFIYLKTLPKRPVRRILICYLGADSIGDALMDLAGRALLRDVPIPVDLLVSPSIAFLFNEDSAFKKVYAKSEQIDFSSYDFLILNNLSLRSIKFKIKWARKLQFACVEGFREKLDYHHTELSFSAINHIFKLGLADDEIPTRSYLSLYCNSDRFAQYQQAMQRWSGAIALAVGGKEQDRIYPYWDKVFDQLDSDLFFEGKTFILVGSENGLKTAQEILSKTFKIIKLISLVGRTDLFESKALIEQCAFFVGVDGGLMHVAHTTQTPTLTIFPARINPKLRITQKTDSVTLNSHSEVNAIDPSEIVSKLKLRMTQ